MAKKSTTEATETDTTDKTEARKALFAEFRKMSVEVKQAEACLAEVKESEGEIVDAIVKGHGPGPYKIDGVFHKARKFRGQQHYAFTSFDMSAAEEV